MRIGAPQDPGRGGTSAHARDETNYPFTWSLAGRRILIVRQRSGRDDEGLRPRRKRKSEKGRILLQKGAADAPVDLRRRGVASQAVSPAYQRSSRGDARPGRHPPPTSVRGPRAVRRSWSSGSDEKALRACGNRGRESVCKANTGCSIIRGVSEASRRRSVSPCPRSDRTSSSPSGSSSRPCCQTGRWTIRWAATALAYPIG